ncbi:molybdenum cofactor biosynthesis protein B [Agaribacterium sp. ZY112]|uniref:molybdenum cofactor biosynthesis protein B n=1 Tax=Agaribacterium sp. ZY112 TaxID=3233574 RepID=UPI003523FF19
MSEKFKDFIPLNVAVLTLSDTRSFANDTSGDALQKAAEDAGHNVVARELIKDDIFHMRAVVSQWIFDDDKQVILITGGTGFTGRDSTPEALRPLFEKQVEGFGELFRAVSYEEIGSSTIQSRATAGLANRTITFCLPGSTGACLTAWNKIIVEQLDSRHRPCNFVGQLIKK